MKYVYLLLDIGAISIPFLCSFYPKFSFYKKWKSFFIATFAMMLFFVSWDVLFTKFEIWGFNPIYLSGYSLLGLPVEEWLFFICIPYACVFTHYTLIYLMPNVQLSAKTTKIITVSLLIVSVVTAISNYDRWYTVINFGYATLLLGLTWRYGFAMLQRFYITYVVILIPFLLINGVLTGSLIENEVVWYANSENLNIRIGTIPIEDSMYAFTMLLTVILLMEIRAKPE